MKYTEEKAKEVAVKYNLSEKTIKVWKTRGRIPDKYFNEGFEIRQSLLRGDTQKYNRLLNVLSLDGINKNVIAEISGVPAQTLIDVRRKEYKMSAQQFKSVKSALNQIKIDIAKVFEPKTESQQLRLLRLLFKRPELRLKAIFYYFDKTEYDRISRFKNEKSDDPGDHEKIKDALTTFAMQINL